MLQITRKGNGIKLFDERLAAMEKADVSGALNKAGGDILTFIKHDVFDSEGAALFGKWRKLSPVYAAWKAKRFPGAKILVQSGTMKNSFRKRIEMGKRLIIDNTDQKFPWHQLGMGVPKRQMLGINQVIMDMVSQRIHELFKK